MSELGLQAFVPELTRLGVESRLGTGAVLWKEGDPGDHVALLLDGLLEVVHESGEGDEIVLRTVESGAVVGEIASTDGRSRSATVRARTPCRVLKVGAGEFRQLLREKPELLEELYWLQVDRVRSLTRQVSRTHHRAITDPLTHLYNFGFFRERLDIEIERARHTGDPVALVMFDIDYFKKYNDTHGHQEGNTTLQGVADILRACARRGDVIARYGGEEFVALFYAAPREEALRYAESVRQKVETHPFRGAADQPGGKVTISAGLAVFPVDASSDEALIKAADMNLYQAKEGGRNRVVTGSAE
jgi:diguanylate cyclase (GGDEF)-like protein